MIMMKLLRNLVARVFVDLDQRLPWSAVGKQATLKISDFRLNGASNTWLNRVAGVLLPPVSNVLLCCRMLWNLRFVEKLEHVWQVSEQGRAVSKKTFFINRKVTRSYVKENGAQQLVKQEICKGNNLLSCRDVHGCVLRADKKNFMYETS